MRIFCSGIGGIGLSAYAMHMHARGHEVFGSDRSGSPLIDDLRTQGIAITLTQDGSALPDSLDLFVYSEAIPVDAPERALAARRGIRQLSYFHAVGELTASTKLVAVCGTHGKSSTTAMTARLLVELGLNPNVIVGTKMQELGGRNWRKGDGDLWVVEACEYRNSFHFLSPKMILLTNADGDHFDFFKSREDYEQSFVEFCKRLPADGFIVTHGGNEQVRKIVEHSAKRLVDADGEDLIELQTPGLHMRQNAQLVLGLAREWKLDMAKAREIISGYSGTWRRLEAKGTSRSGATIIDDYAHHPVEIRATLAALKERYPHQRIACVFQPHTHDRTLKLWDDFAASFVDADLVVISDVYDARPDTEHERADPTKLTRAIAEASQVEATYGGSLGALEKSLPGMLRANDVLIVMGAGTITQLCDKLLAG